MRDSITLITTGGTISSKETEDGMKATSGASNQLVDEVSRLAHNPAIKITHKAPLTKLSENMTPTDWLIIIETLAKAYEAGERQFIITHGTDTMAYAVTAIAVCRQLYPNAVILFTGAFRSPEFDGSDWSINLAGAVMWATHENARPGTCLSFRQHQSISKGWIIAAENVKPMDADATCFTPINQKIEAEFESGTLNSNQTQHSNISLPNILLDQKKLSADALARSAEKIAMIKTYPGLTTDLLLHLDHDVETLIIELYHSGTGPTDHRKTSLVEFVKKSNSKVIFTAFPTNHIKVPYNTTNDLLKAGAHIIKDLQPHQVFVLTVLAKASGQDITPLLQPYALRPLG